MLTCRGCSTAFWGSLFTLLLGWLVILVTGCLKMDAVCLTGRAVFRSGLPCGDRNTATQTLQKPDSCILPVTSTPSGTQRPGGDAKSSPCLFAALGGAQDTHWPCPCLLCLILCEVLAWDRFKVPLNMCPSENGETVSLGTHVDCQLLKTLFKEGKCNKHQRPLKGQNHDSFFLLFCGLQISLSK